MVKEILKGKRVQMSSLREKHAVASQELQAKADEVRTLRTQLTQAERELERGIGAVNTLAELIQADEAPEETPEDDAAKEEEAPVE